MVDAVVNCERVGDKSSYVPTEAYPEFSEFKVHLASNSFRSDEPVEGFVSVDLKEGYENSISDVVIECKGIFYCTFSATQMREVEQIYLSTQRGAAPFSSGGESIAGGKYEFPFSFRIPNDVPGSLVAGEHYTDWNTDGGKLYFKIRAYIIPDENSPLGREVLTISEYFHRVVVQHADPAMQPLHFGSKKYLLGGSAPLEAKVMLNQDTYQLGEEIRVSVDVLNNPNVSVKGMTVKVMQEMSGMATKRSKAFPSLAPGATKTFRRFCLAKEGVSLSKNDFVKGKYAMHTGLTPVKTSSGCVCSNAEKTRLAGSAFVGHENGHLKVEYYVSVEIFVRMGNSLKVKVPFIMSAVEYSEDSSISSFESTRGSCDILPRYSFESQVNDFEFILPSRNRSMSLTRNERMSDVDMAQVKPSKRSLRKRAMTAGAHLNTQTNAALVAEVTEVSDVPSYIYDPKEMDSKVDDSANLPGYEEVLKKPNMYAVPHSLPVKSIVSFSRSNSIF
eukprot:Nk52_evm6s280 gene=Nk52_evmTU6s280